MYNFSDTNQFGPNGREVNFYVTNTNTNNEFLKLHKDFKNSILFQHYNTQLIKNPIHIVEIINYTNNLLKRLYLSHNEFLKSLKDTSLVDKQFTYQAEYFIGIQTVTYLLNKILLSFIFSIEDDYVNPQIKEGKLSEYRYIKDINDFILRKLNNDVIVSVIYNRLVKSENSRQLFEIVSAVNSIYQTQNMFSATNTVGSMYPTIVAVEALQSDKYSYIYHNHALSQIILGFNGIFEEINFYNE